MPDEPQPLTLVDAVADPVGQRAHGGAAELLALEVVHRLDRRVVADHHRHVLRHAIHHGHRLGRDAFGHECHAGSAADADVGAVGGQCLLQLGVAGRGGGFDVKPVLGEDAGLDADVERREGPGKRHRLDDAELFRGACGRGNQHGQSNTTAARNIPRMVSSSMAVTVGLRPKSLQKTVTYAMHPGRGALTRNRPSLKIVEITSSSV